MSWLNSQVVINSFSILKSQTWLSPPSRHQPIPPSAPSQSQSPPTPQPLTFQEGLSPLPTHLTFTPAPPHLTPAPMPRPLCPAYLALVGNVPSHSFCRRAWGPFRLSSCLQGGAHTAVKPPWRRPERLEARPTCLNCDRATRWYQPPTATPSDGTRLGPS